MNRATSVMDRKRLLCEAGSDLLAITSTAYDRDVTGGCIKLLNVILRDRILHQPIIKSRMRGVKQGTQGCDENRIKKCGPKKQELERRHHEVLK